MKLVMTLLVRDEEDVLATHLEYHLARGVDLIIVTDNRSKDSTPAILKRYEVRGLVETIREEADDYSQDRWVTRMAHRAHDAHAADWVIHSDADEFWWSKPEVSLKDAIRSIRPGFDALSVERFDFPPTPETESGFFVDTMTTREVQSFNSAGNPLPPKVCHRAYPDVQVEQGNHGVARAGEPLAADTTDALRIFHFPLRSYRQFANKIANGGAAYERNQRLGAEIGHTWRRLYQLYLKDELSEYYEGLVLNGEARRAGRTDGTLVRDNRLKTFVDQHLDHERIIARSGRA